MGRRPSELIDAFVQDRDEELPDESPPLSLEEALAAMDHETNWTPGDHSLSDRG
jgi:hypothetical protein